jgi:hypothetical protein
MTTRITALCVLLLCAGCAVAPLGHVVSVPPGKTAEQAKGDDQACEDKASLRPRAADSTPDSQGGLASIIPGLGRRSPDDRAREIQRAVWISCMREAGYGVLPPGRDD